MFRGEYKNDGSNVFVFKNNNAAEDFKSELEKQNIEFSNGSLDESFKKGDIIDVPGEGSKHFKAVVVSDGEAVYISQDGEVDWVPDASLKDSQVSKRTDKQMKDLAKEYLKNL